MLREIGIAGGGIIVERDLTAGRLVPLLPGWSMPEFHLYAVYLTHRLLSATERALVDYLVQRMSGERLGGRWNGSNPR